MVVQLTRVIHASLGKLDVRGINVFFLDLLSLSSLGFLCFFLFILLQIPVANIVVFDVRLFTWPRVKSLLL